MIALGTRDRSAFGAALRRQYIQWMIYLLIFGLVIQGVDNAAHLGGLAGGFVVAYLAGTPGVSEAAENFWRLAAGLALAITGYAFFQMFMHLTSTPT
jgi:rhomboid protease GluP